MKQILLTILISVFCFASELPNTLKVGTSADFKPFEYISDNADIVGFDIDLIKLIGSKVGVNIEIINIPFDSLIATLKSGKIDAIISTINATPQRKKFVDFSDPYYKSNNVFVKVANSNLKSKDELKGQKIGAALGSLQEQIAKDIDGAKVVAFDNIPSMMLALNAGKIDAAVLNSAGDGYTKKSNNFVIFDMVPSPGDGMAIVFDKGKNKELVSKINEALKEIKNSGEFETLVQKYGI